jgi:hypothetical protein
MAHREPTQIIGSSKRRRYYKKENKRKYKLVYLTSVWAALADAEDFGSRKAIRFFE